MHLWPLCALDSRRSLFSLSYARKQDDAAPERVRQGVTGNGASAACNPDPSHLLGGSARRRRGREAEGGGLLNRYTLVKAYRGFESLRFRHPFVYGHGFPRPHARRGPVDPGPERSHSVREPRQRNKSCGLTSCRIGMSAFPVARYAASVEQSGWMGPYPGSGRGELSSPVASGSQLRILHHVKSRRSL